jgi:hypothetical protein
LIVRPIGVALLLALSGCDKGPSAAPGGAPAGDALERAAIGAGIVADPATLDPVGAYASDTDRICVTREGGGYRVGASVDYGEQQGCVARGTLSGREALRIDFGDGCRFDGRFDGERITFAAAMPSACERRCTGRATLATVTAPLLSGSTTEARAMRAPDGEPLCVDVHVSGR